MDFKMPTFDRGGSLDDHYMQLMAALGFLHEEEGDTKESAMARAEANLAQVMPSFTLNGKKVCGRREKIQDSRFFLCLSKGKVVR